MAAARELLMRSSLKHPLVSEEFRDKCAGVLLVAMLLR